MIIEVYSSLTNPPQGFVLTPPPEDFGVGRSAYNAEARLSLHVGDALVTRADGSQFVLRAVGTHSYSQRDLFLLLTEAAHDGVKFV